MHKLGVILFLLTLLSCKSNPDCVVVKALGEQANSQIIADLSDELQREHIAGTFDGVVLVRKNDTVLFKSAYGYANRKNAIKNGNGTISDIGSIAKTFTAAAVLLMSQRQQISLSDSLGVFYPNASEELKQITIRQLLSHSSGLNNFHNDSDFEPMNKDQAEARILSMQLLAKPGQKITYSNAAYTLLAAIVENVSQQPFQEYVRSNLLEPLHLNNTGFYQDSRIPVKNVAHGYGGNEEYKTTFERELTWALIGAGGMVSSVDDLTAWFVALREGTIFPSNTPNLVLNEENKRWMLGSLALRNINGESVIQMGGSTDFGYTALIQFVPSKGLMIVLLLNMYGDKYGTSTHHQLSRKHMLSTLLNDEAKLSKRTIQPTANSLAE